MQPTPYFVFTNFERFRGEIFDKRLPYVDLGVGHAVRQLGCFRHPTRGKDLDMCKITLSTKFDLTEREWEDVLIHEMIHFYLWYYDNADPTAHGPNFLRMMQEINLRHGRNITVKHQTDPTRSEIVGSGSYFICLLIHHDEALSIAVCSKSFIFDFEKKISIVSTVKAHKWYWSADNWFSRFPKIRSPKSYKITVEEFKEHFARATECEIVNGTRFRPISRR